MDKAKPILKTLILGLTSLVAILALIMLPLMTCGKVAKAAGTDSYILLDYIEADGTQYIDTRMVPNLSTRWDVDILPTKMDGTWQAMGVYTGNNPYQFFRMSFYTSIGFGLGNQQVGVPDSASQNIRYKMSLDIPNLKGTVNSTTTTLSSVVLSDLPSTVTYLFGQNVSGSNNNPVYGRLYSSQFYSGGTLIRDFIPVKRVSDGKIGLLDKVNNVFYENQGTGSFTAGTLSQDYYLLASAPSSYNLIPVYDPTTNQTGTYNISTNTFSASTITPTLAGGATLYQVSTENALNSALSASVLGDLIVLSGDTTVSSQTIIVGNVDVYFAGHTLSSSYHTNSFLYTTDGWYSTQWTSKASGKLLASTTYTARFQTDVNSATSWGLVLGNSLSGDIINITGDFQYTAASFTIPANVTVNKNGYTILPPAVSILGPIGYNSDPAASTDATSFVANTTYYAIYGIPTYDARLIIDPSVTIDISGIPGATRTEYASYSSIDFQYNFGTAITFPVPSYTGYSFNGWWLTNTTGPFSGISSTDYGDKVFYARWVEAPTITIGNVNIYRNLINNGDRLIMFTSDINWNDLPNDNVRTLFMFRLMDDDGTSVLASTQPYYAYNGGYYLQAVGFYFPDDSVIDWGEEYQIRIDGNPSKWYTISDVRAVYNISGVNYTEMSDQLSNQTELASWIVNITTLLENDWLNYISIAPLITTNSTGNQVLTNPGQAYYMNTVANINLMAPSLFSAGGTVTPLNPDNPMPEIPASPSLITRWENQYEGTWVQDSFQALGDLFHVNWRTITSILCLILWVIFAAISQMKWGTTDAGLWMGAVMFGVMITMGLMNWAVVITAAVLMTLYSVYIVFWRQG